MPPVPAAGTGFSPLDAELGLLPNHRFTPRVEELLARLGSSVAFAEARELLQLVLGVRVSETTLRQRTYSAGRAALAVEQAAQARAGDAPSPPAPAPDRVQLSLDATKVPLVRGAWTEVKLAVFADVVPGPPGEAGEPTADAINLSYVARWEPAEQFGQTITPEAQRRGLDEARVVVSPNDGAEWIQGNLDLVAPGAVRILDFPHAVEHLGAVAALAFGEGTPEARDWVATHRRALLDDGPAALLAALAACQARGPCASARPDAEGRTPEELLAREVAYFTKRAAQLAYPTFRQQGYPLGSGIVESGHKVVIGLRFKGAGQHWASHHLNPLLVLRCASCNDRWAATWAALWRAQCRQAAATRRRAPQRRHPTPPAAVPPPAPGTAGPPPPAAAPRPKLILNGRPTAAHPWRTPFLRPAPRTGG